MSWLSPCCFLKDPVLLYLAVASLQILGTVVLDFSNLYFAVLFLLFQGVSDKSSLIRFGPTHDLPSTMAVRKPLGVLQLSTPRHDILRARAPFIQKPSVVAFLYPQVASRKLASKHTNHMFVTICQVALVFLHLLQELRIIHAFSLNALLNEA